MNDRLKVPIGLVGTDWGGTVAEAWTSRQGLTPLGDFQKPLQVIDELTKPGGMTSAQQLEQWYKQNDPGSADESYAKADFDDSTWKETPKGTRYEDVGLQNFDGVVWYRKEVMMPDPSHPSRSYRSVGSTTWTARG